MIFSLVLLVTSIWSIASGAVPLPFREVLACLGGQSDDPLLNSIILNLRLPRILLVAATGAGLGAVGAAYQAFFRNPLADPFIIGTSSGAALGATVVVVTGWAGASVGVGPTSLGGFLGALVSGALVYFIAIVGRMPPVGVLLAGTAVSAVLGAIGWVLLAMYNPDLPRIISWMMGGFAGRGWSSAQWTVPMILLGITGLTALGRPLNAMLCGDDMARSLGVPVGLLMAFVLCLASAVVAVAVAAGGIIGFIGLIAPHIGRPIIGANHLRLIPVSAMIGAILLQLADLGSRTLIAPLEFPVGIMTALLGGPVFLYVLRRQNVFQAGVPG